MIDTKRQAMQPQTTKTDPDIRIPPPRVPGEPEGDEGQTFPHREESGKSGTVRPKDPKTPASAPGQTDGR